jgi:hypothetical protein
LRATRSWSSSSLPPARDSMSRTTLGATLDQRGLALRYQKRQLMELLGRFTALIWAAMKGHTLVVDQLIAAGAKLDVEENDGYARVAAASPARYSTRQLTSRQEHCTHLRRGEGPHARGRAAHRRRRETRCPKHSRVGPVWRLHRPHSIQLGN